MTMQAQDIRPSPIAGQWYPGGERQLAASIDRMLAGAPAADIPGEVIGLLAPHAGHVYSGAIAARAFKLVEGKSFDRVILLGPMHQPTPGRLLTTAHDAYETPLGRIPVDRVTLQQLEQRLAIRPIRYDPEHSLEIELPFLQRALDGPFSLVPLMLRDQSYPAAQQIGEAIAETLGTAVGTLIIASSDLSHFYADADARALDEVMLGRVADFDPQGVVRVEEQGLAFACGRGAIAAMLVAAKALGADSVEIVGVGTSADTSGDAERVVGYGSAVVYRTDN